MAWIPLAVLSHLLVSLPEGDSVVQAYAGRLHAALHGHDTFPPPFPLVILPPHEPLILDGKHRLTAYRIVQREHPDPLKIRVYLHQAPSTFSLQDLTNDVEPCGQCRMI